MEEGRKKLAVDLANEMWIQATATHMLKMVGVWNVDAIAQLFDEDERVAIPNPDSYKSFLRYACQLTEGIK